MHCENFEREYFPLWLKMYPKAMTHFGPFVQRSYKLRLGFLVLEPAC